MEDISEKKKAIFESTLELIKEHGFHGAPMSQVAKNANVAAGTIYHYFQSKDELICELYAYNKCRLLSALKSDWNDAMTYKEKFYKLWTNLFGFYMENSNVLVFFEQYVNSPYNANKCPNHFKGELNSFFKEGIEAGEIKPMRADILVILTLGSISSTAKMQQFGNMPLNNVEINQIVEVLWEGIGLDSRKSNA